jgi:hypothetical protein
MTQTGPTSCPSVTPVEIGGAASAPTQPWLRWRSSSPCGDEKEWRLRAHSQKRANTESRHTSRSQQRNRPPWRHVHRSLPRHLHSLPAGEDPRPSDPPTNPEARDRQIWRGVPAPIGTPGHLSVPAQHRAGDVAPAFGDCGLCETHAVLRGAVVLVVLVAAACGGGERRATTAAAYSRSTSRTTPSR